MTLWATHARFELRCLVLSRAVRLMLLGVVLASAAVTVVEMLSAERYFELSARETAIVASTQGGAFGLTPFFAFFVAVIGVVMWSQDVAGSSAHVTYASFSTRWRTAVTRTTLLVLVSIGSALLAQAVALSTATLMQGGAVVADNVELIAVKTLWMIVVSVGFGQAGALLCLLTRSAAASLALLLIVPWIVEPLVIQLADLASGLQWAMPYTPYLPFELMSGPLMQAMGDGWFLDAAVLSARDSAVWTAGLTLATIIVIGWRHARLQYRD